MGWSIGGTQGVFGRGFRVDILVGVRSDLRGVTVLAAVSGYDLVTT
jgi:hypothetical protein